MLSNRVVFGAVLEATEGTLVALSATDYMLVEDLEVKPVAEIKNRNAKRNSLDSLPHVVGQRSYQVKFKTELKGSGSAGTAYEPLCALLEACGHTRATAATQSVQSVTVTAGGTGFTSNPTIGFTGGGGSNATAIAVVFGGVIVAIFVTNPGTGYTSVPTVTITGGGGTGATATAVVGGSVMIALTSAPASANFFSVGKSVSINCYYDGKRYRLSGARGDVKLVKAAGDIPMLEFTMYGVYNAPDDQAFPTQTYVSQLPDAANMSEAIVVDNNAAVIGSLEISWNNRISMRRNLKSAGGVGGFAYAGRDIQGSVEIESVLVATDALEADLVAGTQGRSAFIFGNTAGNRVSVVMPVTQLTEFGLGDNEEILTNTLGLAVRQTTGDDSLVMIFT